MQAAGYQKPSVNLFDVAFTIYLLQTENREILNKSEGGFRNTEVRNEIIYIYIYIYIYIDSLFISAWDIATVQHFHNQKIYTRG